ncbi:trehalose-phosphatase [Arthrobacter halodurans]|uniref:Trehalose 6-phosphate phosphatase n=1 Tax=Arthrobacter halodurans TaxID=516699 RepID=A0ABV4UN21_9MICC
MDPGAAALNAIANRSKMAGLVMDFDGVLSPIIDDPSASELLPGTEEVLGSLATKLGLVALLSGRPVDFLADRAAVPGVALYGSYGLEQRTDSGVSVLPDAERWMPNVQAATAWLHEKLDGAEGIHVEDKSLAVAVHWRRAADHAAAADAINPLVQEAASLHGLRREPGKFVEELRIPVNQDKGTALHRIMDEGGLEVTAYAGDDLGDLPAFRAVSLARGHALIVDGPDMAPGVETVAGAHFDGPADFHLWLKRLDEATS